ncbi:MAG: CDP-diacylglycerol--glycerol-3-phosphate 3-phosphatidyltransferase [Candidatus Omnitrophica bacterium]|nr:CDP-diacylglycerol--glycerol-3-phosphate 3-phosphatidyltransferase [Candidatus Omnitrophota bacterium]
MNLPNLLTLMRFFLTCIFVIFVQQGADSAGWAMLVFVIAIATDFMDGYIARRYDLITPFGKIMDPMADKFLTLAAFFMLAFEGLFPLWMVVVIAVREMLVTASRIQYMTRGQVIPAEQTGKIKTVVQMTTITAALIYRMTMTWPDSFFKFYWQGLLFLLIIFSVILTVWSGIEYFRNLPKEDEA